MVSGRRKLLATATAAVVSVALLAGCSSGSGSDAKSGGGTSSSAGGKPVQFLQVVALSGPLATLGLAFKNSAQAAVDVVNAQGGILGRQVKLTTVDDKGDATQAVTALQSALNGSNVPEFVNPGSISAETLPMLPILTAKKIVAIGTSASPTVADTAKFPYAFQVGPTTAGTEPLLVDYLKSKGLTRIGVMLPTQDANGGGAAFDSAAQKAGLSLTTVTVDAAAVDATAQLVKLKSAKPQAIVALQFAGPVIGVILKGIHAQGFTIPVVGDFGWGYTPIAAAVPASDLANVVAQTPANSVTGNPATETPAYKAFVAALDKHASTKSYAIGTYAANYSGLLLYKAAVEKAKSFDPDKVRAALETFGTSTQVAGYVGNVGGPGYSATAHQPTAGAGDFAFLTPTALSSTTGMYAAAGS